MIKVTARIKGKSLDRPHWQKVSIINCDLGDLIHRSREGQERTRLANKGSERRSVGGDAMSKNCGRCPTVTPHGNEHGGRPSVEKRERLADCRGRMAGVNI